MVLKKDLEHIFMIMEINMKDNGIMMNLIIKVWNHLKMAEFIKDSLRIIKWMDTEYFNGQIMNYIKVIGKMVLFVAREYIFLLIDIYMMEIFKKNRMINKEFFKENI